MPAFRLHYEIDGIVQAPRKLEAETPEGARKALTESYAGSAIIIHKVKQDREGVSA